MLTHVHKVIHLVVSTFDQGWLEKWRRLPEVTGRGLRLISDVRCWALSGSNRTMNSLCDQTCRACVRSGDDVRWHKQQSEAEVARLTGAFSREKSALDAYWKWSDTEKPQGAARPVCTWWRAWTNYALVRPVLLITASSHDLTWAREILAVDDQRLRLNAGDTWRKS
jgi:hypothetical protein